MTCHFLEAALTLGGTLEQKETKKRRIFFYSNLCQLLFVFANLALTLEEQIEQYAYLFGSICVMLSSATAVVVILSRRPLTVSVVIGVIYCNCGAFYLWDLNSRTTATSDWALLIVAIDLLLVMQVPSRYAVAVVIATIVWLLVLSVESSYRFGLFDLPGLIPQDGEYGRKKLLGKMVDCETLPCPERFPPNGLVAPLAVFVLDFLVTRGFAREVLQEQASMQRTINAVQEIASLLAKYDVEGVARMLRTQGTELPEQMYETLQTMEENLRRYRPYLPAALFEEEEESGASRLPRKSVLPPGTESETATLVFTDIRLSTMIWETAPEGMRAALKIHNAVMREVMQDFCGYEVKTIGDAFMVAFSTTQDGVNFGLRVHEKLREASWPASLLEDAPICAEQGSLWGGLTVRIGVNTGPVTIEQNTLTGRTDYFGHTVNVASRLESTCKPGAVAVPSDLWSQCTQCGAVAGDAEALDLKGVAGKFYVQNIWPVSLAERQRCRLRENFTADWHPHSASTSARSASTSVHSARQAIPTTKYCDATVATLELAVGDTQTTAMRFLSIRLSTLTVALDQSCGTLVTLLGNRVCVGWSLTRPAPAHMENGIRFAQRLIGTEALCGAGLVSGPVQYGDVGARKQRFVTVMGAVVQRSWVLCDAGVGLGVCIYDPPAGTVLPLALEGVLLMREDGTYSILPASRFDN